MTLSRGSWYAVLSSRELTSKPVGKTRFGRRLVFWRDRTGLPRCLEDRCPHRGAALSLGRVKDGTLACRFHGFRFDGEGRCTQVPAEDNWQIPDSLRVQTYMVREHQEMIWLWRGPEVAPEALPAVPHQTRLDGFVFGETSQIWPTHHTRCMEAVLDYSHLPFVHTKTLGVFRRNPVTKVEVSDIQDGIRVSLMQKGKVRHLIEMTYPSIWLQPLFSGYMMSTTFAPIDETHTEVYYRWYHKLRVPPLRQLVNLWGRLSFFLVFAEDMAILASQDPPDSRKASNEKLVPSDGGIIAYRKMMREHSDAERNR